MMKGCREPKVMINPVSKRFYHHPPKEEKSRDFKKEQKTMSYTSKVASKI